MPKITQIAVVLSSTLLSSLSPAQLHEESKMPDIVIVGEEHGNPKYRKVLLESLPGLVEAGYQILASEKPSNLQHTVTQYIEAAVSLDEKAKTRALWKIAAVQVGRIIPAEAKIFDTMSIPGGDRLEDALRPLVDATLAGLTIQLVDMDSSIISGYLRRSDENQDAAANALHSTLQARNRHMANQVVPKTILLVGRAHTGRDQSSVEYFIRKRGMTAYSLDLRGSDNSAHPQESEDADSRATVEEITEEGGIAPYLRNRKPSPAPLQPTADTTEGSGNQQWPTGGGGAQSEAEGISDEPRRRIPRETDLGAARVTEAGRGWGAGDRTPVDRFRQRRAMADFPLYVECRHT